MANTSGLSLQRLTIGYWDGVNTLVEHNISKKTEPERAENARSIKIGSLEKRGGYCTVGNDITALANYGLFTFEGDNANSKNLWRVSKVGSNSNIYYLSSTDQWTVMAGAGAGLSNADVDVTIAENNCFIVNGVDNNRYILGSDGITCTDSTTVMGHLYGSPKANKINYYKDKLYVGDFYVGSVRYKNGIMMSSKPLGIVALVDGDIASGTSTITVTDTKYIYTASDQLDVYRGGTKITTVTVTAKQEYSVTISGTTSAPLLSSDELWVKDTYGTNARVFRWATNPSSGTPVKRYDTFKLGGGANSAITMMTNIGDVMAMANKNTFMTWNDSGLTNYDSEIGCVSKKGYVKTNNILFFVDYTGVYASTGGAPKLMSSKVQDYFDGATKTGLEAAAAGVQGTSAFFAIGDVTLYNTDGSVEATKKDVCLEYNMRQENWFVHTNIPASQFIKFISSSNPGKIIFSSSKNFKIYDLFNGKTDNGDAIPFSITTSDLTLMGNSYELFAYPRFEIVEVESGNNAKAFVSLDRGQFFELHDPLNKGVNRIPVNPGTNLSTDDFSRCKKIKLRITEFSKGAFKLARLAILFTDSAEFEENT